MYSCARLGRNPPIKPVIPFIRLGYCLSLVKKILTYDGRLNPHLTIEEFKKTFDLDLSMVLQTCINFYNVKICLFLISKKLSLKENTK